jgi:hypothetical protein
MAVFASDGLPRRWGPSVGSLRCHCCPTTGAGPLYTEHPAGTLRESMFRAAFHLEAG